MEVELGKQFDHQVVNDKLETAVADVHKIVKTILQT
jgi:guanylate kinase